MGYQLQEENAPLFLTKKQVKKKIRALFQQIDDNKDLSDYDKIEMKKQVLDRFYQEHHQQISRSTMLELHKWLTADGDVIDNVLLGVSTGMISSFIATFIIDSTKLGNLFAVISMVIGIFVFIVYLIRFTKGTVKTMRGYETVYVNPYHAKLLERYMHRKKVTVRKKLTGRSQHESGNQTTN